MKKLMTFITLSAVAVSIYAQANEQPHQAHMNIINAQQAEIEQMQKWLKAHNKKSKP